MKGMSFGEKTKAKILANDKELTNKAFDQLCYHVTKRVSDNKELEKFEITQKV